MSIKFWLMHNRSRIITALVFCMVFTMLAFAPPFSTSAHAIAVADDAIFLILAALLASSGILLVSESSDTVTDFLQDAVNNFCAQAGESWDTIKSGFRFGVDKLGNIVTNNSILGFFSGFSDWMTRFYSLSDNSDIPLVIPESSFTLANATLNYFPSTPISVNSLSVAGSWESLYAFCYFDNAKSRYGVCIFSENRPTSTITVSYNGSTIFQSGASHMNKYGNYYGLAYAPNSPVISAPLPFPLYSVPLTTSEVYSMLSANTVNSVTQGSSVVADTGTISIPVDGTNYTDEDGAVIGGIGAWGESLNDILEKLREWLDAQSSITLADPTMAIESERDIIADMDTDLLSTDNWPGMLPPSAFTEFSFSSIWHYVTDWLSAFSGALATVLGISFALPAVSIVYAVVVLSLTLWLLRKVSS